VNLIVIIGLDDLLEDVHQCGLKELRALVSDILGGPDARGRLTDHQKMIKHRVYRVRFEINGDVRTLVVKLFSPERAHREQIVIQRWLPRIGLQNNGPPLLGIAAERTAKCTWHVYEDLGDWTLNQRVLDKEHIQAAVQIIVQLHTRFTGNSLLGECRSYGGDLGIYFFLSNVQDAIHSLNYLLGSSVEISTRRKKLINNLLKHLNRLLEEKEKRVKAMEEFAGPETFLHGDLWTTNIFVLPSSNGPQVRLIDWDHSGVGPITYDLSTLLLRFPLDQREWIFNYYKELVRDLGWLDISRSALNLLFDTAETSRLANTILWLANFVSESGEDLTFNKLAAVEKWFNSLAPVLPPG
jgi:thiamine kinase-like enzyme